MKIFMPVLLLICFHQSAFAQRKFIGVDFGYQYGQNQYFETGLNFTFVSDNVMSSFSVGIEDNINAKEVGYKLGLSGFLTKQKLPPILFAIGLANHRLENRPYSFIRPEIGIAGAKTYGGRGFLTVQLTYGYNMAIHNQTDQLNTHLVRFSINTNLIGLIELIGIATYR